MVVNLDPRATHDGVCVIPPELRPHTGIAVVDALTGAGYEWGARNYVRLGPGQAHVMAVTRT